MSFSDQIAKFNEETKKKLNLVYRRSCFELSKRIIMRTPVGNSSIWKTKYPPKGYVGGRLRGNWQMGINSRPSGTLKATDKSGGSTVSKVQRGLGSLKIGRKFYLYNNLPYAHAVEFGHSKQAPKGMMRVSVKEWKNIVKLVASTI